MRILIDTNVLISTALNVGSISSQAYTKAVSYPNHGIICEQNVIELKRIFSNKFSDRLIALDNFLALACTSLELVPMPNKRISLETKIRDVNDRPILRAAVKAKVDIILTGDKDFLEAGIVSPRILSPKEFLAI